MIIDEYNLRKYSMFPINYDLSEVMGLLDVTEALFVRPLLGEELYDEICAQVADDNLSEANATLLTDGGVWQYLGVCFTLQALPFAYAHVSQVGVTKGKSDNSDSVDLKDITYLTGHLRSNAEELKRFTFRWLSAHMGSFPTWEPESEFCGCAKPATCCGEPEFVEPQPMRAVYGLPRKSDKLS